MKTDGMLFIDLETTGVKPLEDKICQIGLINTAGEEYETLVNPGMPIPAETTEIHGITDAMVTNAPKFLDIAEYLIKELEKADYFVAYNSIFDFQFLQQQLYETVKYSLDENEFTFIDPYKIFKTMFPQTLSNAYKFYTGKPFTEAHNALADIKATKEVLISQSEQYPELFSKSFEEIEELTIGDTHILGRWFSCRNGKIYFKIGKHKDQELDLQAHDNYLRWIGALPDITVSERNFIKKALI